MHNQVFGRWGEERAVEYLVQQGYKIVARNWRTKYGEIDIIAQRGQTLYFFEVKSRSTNWYGRPALAVDWKKRRNWFATAHWFIHTYSAFERLRMRFGIIEYYAGSIHVMNLDWQQSVRALSFCQIKVVYQYYFFCLLNY